MNFSRIVSLKGEFEAEGLTRDTVAAEAAFAARNGLPYLVKIGGCEAKSDMRFLMHQGIRSIVAPMIESAFAMKKYQDMLPEGAFDHVGVTIETETAVDRIEAILDAGVKLSEVTVGRSDLTASFGGSGVNCAETLAMVKTVARAAKARGLATTMGGTVNAETFAVLREDDELRDLIACVETRKCVMPVAKFLEDGALADAFAVEQALLDMQVEAFGAIADGARSRTAALNARL
ncbi:HpcH/HpaI aldolase/citrate lyase family protein [Novosphingobium kunmingense]|uniref:HpcH/HpaI aldolase/citrate lyase family protein n=1 Tax=Novosphingobium kunmingense TaxID=1211806 RepID=A0A2N0H6I8_9SPHN|nr:aldolase/citrate lyase family protein [Novosphingobium kunmingense]PKB14537.1 HpcH/HpaI aldolase/citrate lyase family protein [Novosphingobium kunmingense]